MQRDLYIKNAKKETIKPNIKELSRSICVYQTSKDRYMPVKTAEIVAEIRLDHDGREVFLHGIWSSKEAGIVDAQTSEKSIFDICKDILDCTDKISKQQVLERIKKYKLDDDTIVYWSWYNHLSKMIMEEFSRRRIVSDEAYLNVKREILQRLREKAHGFNRGMNPVFILTKCR